MVSNRDNVTRIGRKKLDSQALDARLFLEGFVESLGVLPPDDVAHLFSMVLADLAKSVLIDFHKEFCNKNIKLGGEQIMTIIINNLIAYTNHLHEQIVPPEHESKH